MARIESDPIDRDERLGEAIESYLELVEDGSAPDPDEFAGRYPDLGDDLREALDGLALVRGLVGDPTGPGRPLEAGRRVAGYRIVRELGRGGMGVVYEAVHVDLDRPVALKVLGNHAAPDSNGRRRFLNEAKTAAGLHHTHIVPVFDVGQVGGLCYYAMQRIEGCGLDRVVKSLRRDRSVGAGSGSYRPGRTPSGPDAAARDDLGLSISGLGGESARSRSGVESASAAGADARRPRLRPRADEPTPFEPPRGSAYYRWVAQLGRMAAEALAYAHRRGVIHRDVKPSNLLVDARGSVWMADFGLARRLADPGITQTDSLLGTPRYMSPEQARGGPIDGRTDVYSLGATLYELLTLRPPFEGRTAAELVQQILHREPAPPRKADRRIPRDLETIVLKAMSKRPSDRYADASELADDLARFVAVEPVKARRIGPLGRAWRFARRHPSLSSVTAVAAVTILAVATWAHLSVVQQRNEALAAKADKDRALKQAERANSDLRAAQREILLNSASVTLLSSNMLDRRKTGLETIGRAAALDPDPAMRVRLRDLAVEFLALRDVEPRPPLETGRAAGLAFLREDDRLAVLREDADESGRVSGVELALWDLDGREPLRSIPLGDAPPARGRELRGSRGRDPLRSGTDLAAAGQALAVVRPDGRGVHLLAPSGAPVAELAPAGRLVESIFASPDGRRLVTLERGGPGGPFASRVVLWDPARPEGPLATLTESADIEPGAGGPDAARRPPMAPRETLVAFSPDGRRIATARFRGGGPDDEEPVITLRDAADGSVVSEVRDLPEALTALALGPDGLIAAALTDGTVRIWDGARQAASSGLNHGQSFVRGLRFSPDGTLLAVVGLGTGIELWDPATSTLMATVRTPDWVSDVAFSPDGRTLAASSGRSVSLWTIVEPVGRVRLSGFDRPVTSLAFGPGGQLAMASWFDDRGPRLWHPGRCPTTARTLDEARGKLVAFDDAGRLVAVDPEGIDWVDPATGAVVEHLGLFEPRRPATPPGPWPALGAAAAVQGVPADAPRRPSGRRPGPGWNTSVALSPAPGGRALAFARAHEVFLWRSEAPDALRRLAMRPRPDAGAPAFGPDPGRNGRVGRPPTAGWFGTIALAADLSRLYLVSFDGELHAWAIDDPDGRPAASPLPWSGSYRNVSALALAADGRALALGSPEGDVRLIDTANGAVVATIDRAAAAEGGPDGHVQALAFSPDGQLLAVGPQRGRVALWSLADPRRPAPLAHLPGHQGDVRPLPLAFSPDGRLLASTGDGRVVEVWDLAVVRRRLDELGLAW